MTLTDSERRFRALMEKASELFVIVDAAGTVVFESPNQNQLMGFATGELLGRNVFQMLHPDDRALARTKFEEILQHPGAVQRVAVRTRTKQGNWRWLEVVGTNLLNDPAVTGIVLNARDITERKEADDALRKSEQFSKNLIETMSDGFSLLDANGVHVDVNPSFCRMTGFTREELIGVGTPHPYWPEEEMDAIQEAFAKTQRGEGNNFELIFKRKNGERFPVMVSPSQIKDENGRVIYYFATVKDITEHKRLEQQLREEQQRLELIVENTLDVVYRRNLLTDRYDYFSPAAEVVTGFTAAELCGGGVSLLLQRIHPSDVDRARRILEEMERGQHATGYAEYRFLHKNGTYRWFADHFRILRDLDGRGLYWLGIVRDITDRKQAETILAASERRFRALVEAVPGGITILDATGRIVFDAVTAGLGLGVTRDELLGKSILDFLHPDDRAKAETALRQVLENPDEPLTLELRAQTPKGMVRTLQVTAKNQIHDPAIRGIVLNTFDLTERKRAEEALRKNEQVLRILFKNATDGIVVATPEGKAIMINEAFASMHGYTPEEIAHLDLRTLDTPESARMAPERIRRLLSGEDLTFEVEHFRKDGSTIFLEVSATTANLGDGVFLFGFHRDITARKRAEEALRESEQRYRRLVETLTRDHFIYRHDTQGKFTYISESVTSVLGFTPDEFKVAYDKFLTDHPVNEEVRRHTALSIQGIQQPPYEVNSRHKDGTDRWLEVYEVPVFGPSGEVIAVEGVAQDITARKRAEEALRESEEKLRLWLDSIPHYAWLAKPDGRVILCNRRWFEYTGQRPDEAIEDGWSKAVHPDDLERVMQKVAEDVAGGERYECEYRLRRASDGQYRWQLARGLPLKDNDGNILGWCGAGVDIDDQKRLEQQLQHRLALEELASSISHRLINASPQELDQTITESLGELGQFLNAGYASLFQVDNQHKTTTNTHEWAAPNLPPQQARYQNIPLTAFPWVYQQMQNGQPVVLRHLDDLPAEAEAERRNMERVGSRSLLQIPLHQAKQLNAYLVFDAVGVERDWSDEDIRLLQVIGERFTSSLARRKAIEALELRERWFRALTEKSADIVVVIDATATVLYESPQLQHPLGYAAGELIGRKAFEFLHPDDTRMVQDLLQEALKQPGGSQRFEVRLRARDGSWRVAEVIGTNLLQDPAVQGIVLNFRDISERKEAETRLRAFLENSAVIGWLKDEAGRYVFLSDNYERRFAIRREEWIGKTDFELWPREVAEVFHRNDQIVLQGRKPIEAIEFTTDKNGNKTWWLNYKFFYRDSTGKRFVGGLGVDITERRQAEQLLRESEKRLKRTEQIAHLGSWELDLTRNVLTWSDEVYRIFGLEPQEFAATYEAFLERVHPDDRAAVDAAYTGSIRDDRDGYEIEFRIIQKNTDAVRIVHLKCDHLRNTDGQIVRSVGMVHDITERKLAEQALRDSEERYRGWLEAIPMLAWQCNPKGEAEMCNARWYEYTGEPPEQTLGNLWQNALHPDDRDRIARETIRCAQTGDPYNVEYRLRRHDGTYRWHLARAVPVRDHEGNIVMWVGCAADIEDQKQLEQALRNSEEEFRVLADTVPQHIWITDARGRPEYVNRQRVEYTGLTLEGAQAANGWWEAVHPDDRPALRQSQGRVFKDGSPLQWEYRLRCAATGQYRWFLGRVVPIKDAQGQILKWFCTATDIDEQKRQAEILEQRVRERTAQLQQEMLHRERLEREILAISEREQRRIGQDLHDSVGQRLAGAKFLSSSLSRRLARVHAAGAMSAARVSRELDKALDELRAISRGLHPVQPEAESLMLAFHELAHNTQKLFKIPCHFDCPQPVLIYDHYAAIHLYRITQEAVGNAARHGKPSRIRISLHQTQAGIELQIRDNGRGLPPPSRRREGMGLQIMKHRANVIGATLTIRRVQPRGTIVSCRWTPPTTGANHAH